MPAHASLPRFLPYSEVRVTIPAGEAGLPDLEFTSHLLAASEDGGRLLLDRHADASPGLRKGMDLRLTVDDGIKPWAFASRIESFETAAPWGFWVVRPLDPGAYAPIQQRQMLRVAMELPVVLSVPQADGRALPVRGKTLDLGGGGLRVQTQASLPEGQLVKLRLPVVPDAMPLEVVGRVIACRRLESRARGAPTGYESRMAFEGIDEAVRSQILRECYRIQIEQRRGKLPLE